MSYKFKNGHIIKKIVTSSIIESEIKSKMLRESFENAEKIFLMKSLSRRSLENHFIGFFEKMRRHNWIKGESSMIDSLIALKVTNTLLLTCHQKELIDKNTFISFQHRLVMRTTKHLETIIIEQNCAGVGCKLLKFLLMSPTE